MTTFSFIDDSGKNHILTKNLQLYLHTEIGQEMFPKTYYVISIIGYKDLYVSKAQFDKVKGWLDNDK